MVSEMMPEPKGVLICVRVWQQAQRQRRDLRKLHSLGHLCSTMNRHMTSRLQIVVCNDWLLTAH